MNENLLTDQLNVQQLMFTYSYAEMVLNILVAIGLGFVISAVYRQTHKGLSYSQSFTLTILYVCVIVAVVMMVIGGSLARAFALVGALSIIRFRTVIKDTKDTAFVFLALAVGMAAGTSNYFLAFVSTVIISMLALIVHQMNYGALYKSEFILRFLFEESLGSTGYQAVLDEHCAQSHLLHIEPTGEQTLVKMTFDVRLKDNVEASQLVAQMRGQDGLSDIVLIASKNDVDY